MFQFDDLAFTGFDRVLAVELGDALGQRWHVLLDGRSLDRGEARVDVRRGSLGRVKTDVVVEGFVPAVAGRGRNNNMRSRYALSGWNQMTQSPYRTVSAV